MWQRVWDEQGRRFQLLAVAQDAYGADPVRRILKERPVSFPVLIDQASTLGEALGFRVVPSGFFVDADGCVRYRHLDDFDVADPRVAWNLDRFLAGRRTESPAAGAAMKTDALELFAGGVSLHSAGRRQEAIQLWRSALELDQDNFIIRSQIWVAEHPERFYPTVDREWQERQLLKEGYDKPLP